MKIIIDLPDYFKDKLSKRDYNALEKVYIKQAISKGIILKNATNGDIFNAIVDVDNDCVDVHGENGYMTFVCTQEWWDSPYKDSEKNTAKTTTLKKPANAIAIPEHATNGDVLKAMFPKAECKREQDVVYFDVNIKGEIWFSSLFDIAWWNAEYQEPSSSEIPNKSEIPTGSDDKNDLGVAISREDALMCLTGKFEIREYEPSELISIFSKRIKALPPVTPIRPKGQWIEERNDYGEITHWHCSNCYDDSGFITTCKWDFCPNCGADMREVGE